MKRITATIAIALTTIACQGNSSDVTVKSDLDETSVVRKSSVTMKVFDKTKALSALQRSLSAWNKEFSKAKCAKEKYKSVKNLCLETHKENVVPLTLKIEGLKAMPEFVTVRYRRIFTDVNGDRSATGYEIVHCLPDGTKQEVMIWKSIVKDETSAFTNKSDIEDNLKSHSQHVADAVCARYGKRGTEV